MGSSSSKPDWLRIRATNRPEFLEIRELLRSSGLRTICDSAHCPNICDCWSRRSATFLILGETCTRSCRFCAVKKGQGDGLWDRDEADRLALAVERLGLTYVVLTSVTRDDLEDRGSEAYATAIHAIKDRVPSCGVEVLIPDMDGDERYLSEIIMARPDVIGHNIETVRRITAMVRDGRASYDRSLGVLRAVKRIRPEQITKSSLMLGLGEKLSEVQDSFDDLRWAGVDILTIGQYLRPGPRQVPVAEYIEPSVFEDLRVSALGHGFGYVVSGPFVRSSLHAEDAYHFLIGACQRC